MTENNELIECMAKAMFNRNNRGDDWLADDVQEPIGCNLASLADNYRQSARAALTAYRNHQVEL